MFKEPKITINGTQITDAMAMTIRVAVNSFAFDISNNGLGEDEHGKEMAKLYLKRVDEINDLISPKKD